jgi:hypothetical protein
VKRAGQLALFFAFVFLGVASAYNVMSDNHDVEAMAKGIACAFPGDPEPPKNGRDTCHPQTTRIERTPIAQSFSIVTARHSVDVRCTRAFIFVGDYACVLR